MFSLSPSGDHPGPPDAFADAFARAPLGMALADTTGRVLRVNDALCRITGHTAQAICARPFAALSDTHDVDVDAQQMADLLNGRITVYHVEKRFRHALGHRVWVLVSLSLGHHSEVGPRHVIAQVQDISERKKLEGHLEHLVEHDLLTGLFNSRRFEQALMQETKAAHRYGSGGAILLLDLDHFKTVNDRFGHQAGDDLLRTVAAALRERIRETDVLARLGGDEFGIILPRANAQQAEVFADSVVKAVRRHSATLADQHIPISVSVGVAMFDDLTDTEILAAADLAMYEAKEAGRDRFATYRPKVGGPLRWSSRMAEAERIQQALNNDQLELQCQPILDLRTSTVDHYELLLRLRNDDGLLLPPSAFLYVAERFGTIVAIDSWVVRHAGALIDVERQAGRTVRLSVNLSPKSIASVDLLAALDLTLADRKIDPACLVFELTETTAVGNIEQARSFITEVRRRGCRVALDNFGTGFASFHYLKHLPFDYFKIDGDFVHGCNVNTSDRLIVEAIAGIARGLDTTTVAKSVTDAETMACLHRCGIDCAQGLYLGAPRPVLEAFPRQF